MNHIIYLGKTKNGTPLSADKTASNKAAMSCISAIQIYEINK